MGRKEQPDRGSAVRSVYAALPYPMKGDYSKSSAISDGTERVSPAIGELARIYRLVERGELDIWEEKKN